MSETCAHPVVFDQFGSGQTRRLCADCGAELSQTMIPIPARSSAETKYCNTPGCWREDPHYHGVSPISPAPSGGRMSEKEWKRTVSGVEDERGINFFQYVHVLLAEARRAREAEKWLLFGKITAAAWLDQEHADRLAAEAERDRLAEIIENAPHTATCHAASCKYLDDNCPQPVCDCWKARARGEGKT